METEIVKSVAAEPQSSFVEIKDGQPLTDSLKVAQAFGRAHKNILRAIDKLVSSTDADEHGRTSEPMSFGEHGRTSEPMSFGEHERTGEPMPQPLYTPAFREVKAGMGAIRKERYYTLNRDGFMLLIMNFKGEMAQKFQYAFIEAFNRMEQRLIQELQSSNKTLTERNETLLGEIRDMEDYIDGGAKMKYTFKEAARLLHDVHYNYTALLFEAEANNRDAKEQVVPQNISEQLKILHHLDVLFSSKVNDAQTNG